MTEYTPPPDGSGIQPINISDEMQRSFVDYAMSVIVSRALPDVRDGLKPVHRRILYAMHENGYHWNRKFVKSAKVVGDVMGTYHPHGDGAIYDALVRMTQDWSMRVPLVDGQGNFGSIDNDPAAAMRYTECRLEKVSHSMLEDIDKETVDFQDTYDGATTEPKVVPARFPNLLVNGAGGIAVGMATNVPPHNLIEVCDAAIALIDDPTLEIDALEQIVPGPDFPTGGLILGRAGIRSAYGTGRGSILMRAAVHKEEKGDRESIVATEIPYQVNKAAMIARIAELVREKRLEGISDIRDESDRDGYRVVIDLKRDAVYDVVLNQLYKFTPLQTSFGANMVALNGGKPEQLNLLDILQAFIAFREEVVTRRTKFLLRRVRERAHVLVGLAIAVANIDEVIALIRSAPNPAEAREGLMSRRWPAKDVAPLIELIDDPRHMLNEDGSYTLSEEQARAILDLRLQRLTALGREEIDGELEEIAAKIRDYLDILSSRARVFEIVKSELEDVKKEFGTPRRTQILDHVPDMDDEDLIAREDMVVTVSHEGYIKRVPLDTYREQRRGGKGRSGMQTKDGDFVTRLFVANTHTPILFFTSRGIVHRMKVWRLPEATPQSRGRAFRNLLPLVEGERITSVMPMPEDEESWTDLDVVFATTRGSVRRNKLSDFARINQGGKIAMKFDGDDVEILGVETCTEDDDVLITTAMGQGIRFPVTDVRVFRGRDSQGVRGISLAKGDRPISMTILRSFESEPWERTAFLKRRRAETVEAGDEADEAPIEVEEGADASADSLPDGRYAEMVGREQFVLTVSENGFGKRSSSYDFPRRGRGGKGIRVTDPRKMKEIGEMVALFRVDDTDGIMLVTNGGQLIRTALDEVAVKGRATRGVRIFRTAEGESIVSVERIPNLGGQGDEVEEPGDVANGDPEAETGAGGDAEAPA